MNINYFRRAIEELERDGQGYRLMALLDNGLTITGSWRSITNGNGYGPLIAIKETQETGVAVEWILDVTTEVAAIARAP